MSRLLSSVSSVLMEHILILDLEGKFARDAQLKFEYNANGRLRFDRRYFRSNRLEEDGHSSDDEDDDGADTSEAELTSGIGSTALRSGTAKQSKRKRRRCHRSLSRSEPDEGHSSLEL